jgi:division protein CdvB (Snf7/Vps24/ESCRT-III family)
MTIPFEYLQGKFEMGAGPMKFSFFGSKREGDLRAKIDPAIKKLEVYKREIIVLRKRIEERRERLFLNIVKSLQNNERDKATVYANEHAEVKKIIKVLNACDVALSQIIVRLESIRDVGEAMKQIDGAFRVAKSLSKQLVSLPQELSSTASNLQEELIQIMSELGQLSPSVSIAVSDYNTEEIIQEAMQYLEERGRSVLPDPISAPPTSQLIKQAKLLATGTEEREDPFTLELYSSPIDDTEKRLFNYIASRGGRVNVNDIAYHLKMSIDDVEKMVVKLVQEGKLKVKSDR